MKEFQAPTKNVFQSYSSLINHQSLFLTFLSRNLQKIERPLPSCLLKPCLTGRESSRCPAWPYIYLKSRGYSRHAVSRCMTLMTIYGAKSAKPSSQKFIRQWKSGKPFYVPRSNSTFIPNPAEHERYSSKTQRNKNNKFVKTACGRSKFSGVIYAWRGIYKFGRRFKLTVDLRVVFLFFTQRIGRQILCRFFYPVVCWLWLGVNPPRKWQLSSFVVAIKSLHLICYYCLAKKSLSHPYNVVSPT